MTRGKGGEPTLICRTIHTKVTFDEELVPICNKSYSRFFKGRASMEESKKVSLDAEFRNGYRQWREGKPLFPKGDMNKPPAHAVTLVYREEGLKTTWELQLMGLPRLSPATRFPYRSGYAKWNMATRSQPSQAPASFAARGA